MDPTGVVCAWIELRMVVPVGPALPVLAALRYDARDPWAVRVTFSGRESAGDAEQGAVEWLFARSLLADGVRKPVGMGDVRVRPSGPGGAAFVTLVVTSASGSARFEVDRHGLVGFLQQTYERVPLGAEDTVIDLDAELAALLDRA